MKVLHQTWELERGRTELNSISKDRASYEEAVVGCANASEDRGSGPAHPTGELFEITIPDNSVFARMVESQGTVFLHADEMDEVWGAPEWET